MNCISFLVNDITFDIPIEKIPKGCLLLELHKASGKFHVDTIDGKYILEVDPVEFKLVHKYLIEGTLSKELYLSVKHLFEYLMIDYNEFGYPQEFFEIKKKEDYIRKNFNDPTFVNHPMRSMYYNLIELTEDVYNDIFFGGERLEDSRIILSWGGRYPQSFTKVRDRIQFMVERCNLAKNLDGVIIAGGSILTYALGLPLKDIDLFLVDTHENIIEEILSRFDASYRPIFYRSQNCISIKIEPVYKNSDNIIVGNYIARLELQIILRKYTTVSEVITGFDVDCCGVCYEPSTRKFWITPRAMYSIKNMVNIVDFDRLSPSYEYRLIKYSNRGFGVFVPFFDPSKVNIGKVMSYKVEEDMKGDLIHKGTCKDKGLDLLIRYIFNRSAYDKMLTPKDYDVNKGYTKNINYIYYNTFISVYVSDTRECETDEVKRILDENRLVIHCSLPCKNEGYIEFIDSSLSPYFHIDDIRDDLRDLGVMVYDFYEFEDISINYIQGKRALYEAKRLIKFYSSPNYKNILCLSRKTYCILEKLSTLTRGVELMTVNPGQQLTGSFHRLVLDDYRVWYKSDFYTL